VNLAIHQNHGGRTHPFTSFYANHCLLAAACALWLSAYETNQTSDCCRVARAASGAPVYYNVLIWCFLSPQCFRADKYCGDRPSPQEPLPYVDIEHIQSRNALASMAQEEMFSKAFDLSSFFRLQVIVEIRSRSFLLHCGLI
jgi:hypothetical protein